MANERLISKAEIAKGTQALLRINNINKNQSYTYHIESYGCQMNDHDSEKLASMLENAGFSKTDDKRNMDLILFNTCCVREHSEKRVFGNIGALKKTKDERPNLIIAVCGCMTQQKGMADKLFKRFPFVDIIFGTNELHNFPLMLESAINNNRVLDVSGDDDGVIAEGLPASRASGFSTNVIIMYGCNNFCSYCIVPYVRGRERSRTPENILNEIKELSAKGYKEITLLGQNVNSYLYDGIDFPTLLSMVNEVDGIERIRFMTSHPKDLSPGLIEAMATQSKVCAHIHLPMQSGSDAVLQMMNRKYTRAHYINLVKNLRVKVPDIEITTDIIVGFPGETDADFLDTINLVEEVGFSGAYTFKYSKRTGTQAATMENQVPQSVKEERLSLLNKRVAELLQAQNKKYIGVCGDILVEGCDTKGRKQPMAYGKLPNFKMVYFPGDESLIGSIVPVKITTTRNNSLIGERLQ